MSNTADQMRQEFDQTFAVPARPAAGDHELFLAIRVAGRPFVLRVAELSRLERARKIVALPGGRAALLGLAGIQGRLTPVYSLADFLGLGTPVRCDWIAVCGRDEPVGLAFDAFERALSIPRAEILLGGGPESAVRAADAVRPILQLPSLLVRIRDRAGVSDNSVKGP